MTSTVTCFMCLLFITAADGPDCTCGGTYINRGTSIWTSEWVMNLNPFWSMSANTSRKVKPNTLNYNVFNTTEHHPLSTLCGKANNIKLNSKDILQWLKACIRWCANACKSVEASLESDGHGSHMCFTELNMRHFSKSLQPNNGAWHAYDMQGFLKGLKVASCVLTLIKTQ